MTNIFSKWKDQCAHQTPSMKDTLCNLIYITCPPPNKIVRENTGHPIKSEFYKGKKETNRKHISSVVCGRVHTTYPPAVCTSHVANNQNKISHYLK